MITIKDYSEKIKIPVETMLGKSRVYDVASARETYWLYLRQKGLTVRKIAATFNRSHSTVLSGINTAQNLIATKDEWTLSCFGKLI
ncbi:MAG: hypothetical protein LBF08_08515 [Dysgonamonadaceae bacterium]|nr:hypothetical protein [Dysgonamonadaceae bacterium]